jgi:hypothetical protein
MTVLAGTPVADAEAIATALEALNSTFATTLFADIPANAAATETLDRAASAIDILDCTTAIILLADEISFDAEACRVTIAALAALTFCRALMLLAKSTWREDEAAAIFEAALIEKLDRDARAAVQSKVVSVGGESADETSTSAETRTDEGLKRRLDPNWIDIVSWRNFSEKIAIA